MPFTIRFVEEADIDQLIDLCEAHAHYEQARYTRTGKAVQLAADLFCETPKLYGLVVEQHGNLVGYATYMRQYATWDANDYVYLDCLFLDEAVRGLGIGTQLMERVREETQRLGCSLIQWQTPDFNTRAITFYNRLGATSKSKERFFWEM